MNVIAKVLFTLIVIVSSQFICVAQDYYTIKRSSIERKNSHKTYCKDSIKVPMNKITDIDGFYLYPDTLFFSGDDVYVNLPNKSHKQIDYFEGKKIYDIFLFQDMSKPNVKVMPDTVAILSFWYGGDHNSLVSFNDDVQVVEKISNTFFSETFGEKRIGENTIYFRKRDYLTPKLSIILINCKKDKLDVCNTIFDSITLQNTEMTPDPPKEN